MKTARITIFAGHYGSGKTTLAVNYARWLKKQHSRVALCDLDIVNPYFRTADAKAALDADGIQLIASDYANTNVELPAMPSNAKAIFDDRDIYAVIDLGGDDRGALALGRYAGLLRAENNYEMLLVVNKYRPLTRNLQDLTEIKHEIETAGQVPFTGIVNNSNLGDATTREDVQAALPFAQEVQAAIGLAVKMTAVDAALLQGGEDWITAGQDGTGDVFPVEMYKKNIWRI